MTRVFWLLLGIACAGAAGQEKAWHTIRSNELQGLFADQELGDGVHYAYRSKSSGTFAGTEMGKDVQDTWRTTARHICWTWIKPAGSEECYEIRRNGNDIRLFLSGYEAFFGSLAPIKANI